MSATSASNGDGSASGEEVVFYPDAPDQEQQPSVGERAQAFCDEKFSRPVRSGLRRMFKSKTEKRAARAPKDDDADPDPLVPLALA